MDVRHDKDQNLPTKESIITFTESLERSGHSPTILPLLIKSYDLQAVVKDRFRKQNASNKIMARLWHPGGDVDKNL